MEGKNKLLLPFGDKTILETNLTHIYVPGDKVAMRTSNKMASF